MCVTSIGEREGATDRCESLTTEDNEMDNECVFDLESCMRCGFFDELDLGVVICRGNIMVDCFC